MNLSLLFGTIVFLGTIIIPPQLDEKPQPFSNISMPSGVCEQAFIISNGVCYIWLNPYLDENKKIDELKKLAIMETVCKDVLSGIFHYRLNSKAQTFNYFCMRDKKIEQEKYDIQEKIHFAHHA